MGNDRRRLFKTLYRFTVPSFRWWSNSRQSWIERSAAAFLIACAGAAFWFGSGLPSILRIAIWLSLLVSFAYCLRRDWIQLFGPVLSYDLVRTSRRRPFLVVRFLYIAGLSALFFLVAADAVGRDLTNLDEAYELLTFQLGPRQISDLAEQYFYLFLLIQIAAVFLLTPVTVAGAIPEERQRRTLEFLLATDLRSREIIFGTLASRLTGLLLIIMGGMPILSLVLFLGGVDPEALWTAFAATGLSMVSLASLSILNSVLTRRPLDAILRTYLEAIAFLSVSGGFKVLLILASLPVSPVRGIADFPSTLDWTSPVTLQDICDWLNAGNLGWAVIEAMMKINGGTPLNAVLPDLLESYAWFHGLFIVICLTWATVRLRPIALKLAEGPAGKRRGPVDRPRLPPVGRWPILWKEMHAEGGLGNRRAARRGIGFLALLSLTPALGALAYYTYLYPFGQWDELAEFLNGWTRVAGTSIACLLAIFVAIRAAGSVTGERDRQTFDLLLTSPLSSRTILEGKWLGAFLSARRGWIWLGAIWALAYFGGGLELGRIPLLAIAWLVYASFCASLGLWFSVRCRTTTRAVLGTVIGILVVTAGHWLMLLVYVGLGWLLWYDSIQTQRLLRDLAGWLFSFHQYGLTPPATLDFITEQSFDDSWRWNTEPDFIEHSLCAVWGLGLYAAGAGWLWLRAERYFRKAVNRAPVRQAPGLPLAAKAKPEFSPSEQAAVAEESVGKLASLAGQEREGTSP